jgi:hypothetical protein
MRFSVTLAVLLVGCGSVSGKSTDGGAGGTGVDPVWWTPTLSQMGVEKVPHVEDGNEEAGPARPHARVQG